MIDMLRPMSQIKRSGDVHDRNMGSCWRRLAPAAYYVSFQACLPTLLCVMDSEASRDVGGCGRVGVEMS